MLTARTAYDKEPEIAVSGVCLAGWADILAALRARIRPGHFVICIECYPGSSVDGIAEAVEQGLRPDLLIRSGDLLRPPEELDRLLAPVLTDDPVFGRMNGVRIDDFLCPERVHAARLRIDGAGLTAVVGTGAAVAAGPWDLLVYVGMARWEIQQRQRRNLAGNLGAGNETASAAEKYKRAFFVDWRAADRLKVELFDRIDFFLDGNAEPKMVAGGDYRAALEIATRRPFRVVPFFDPGPWGGQWMRERFQLPDGPPNYAWCFDCVPEENSLFFRFGPHRIEAPAIDMVLRHPRELLGDAVYRTYGAEFPIRFDLLDTWEGGNLSLQVHPKLAYIREHFGMAYTQDESYYLLDCGANAGVYLGLRDDADPERMTRALWAAQDGTDFPAEEYVNFWPARKHDHFLIPAGTIHCSGRNSVVLEISATPYIFTFKLWDWGRMNLDGQPRPVHIEHGLANIDWTRRTEWVRRELINRIEPAGPGEERTGLHPLEILETRRHWFRAPVRHDTRGVVNVLNLVEGEGAVVESPEGRFDPFPVHYAETFIIPAAVGPYTIRPLGPGLHATMKAWPRTE